MSRLLGFALLTLALLATRAVASPGPVQTFTARGAFLYEDKAWGYNGWTGSDPLLPVRLADVTIFDAASGRRLGRGITGEDGSFEVECSTRLTAPDVQARCDSSNRHHRRATGARFTPLRVVSASHAVYSAFSAVAPAHDPAADVDLGTTVALKMISGGHEANPFNVFDMLVASWQYVTGPEVGGRHSRRRVALVWPSYLGSYAWKRRAWIATDDGYDDAVILHEIGHVVHNVYSDSDNPGGVHYFGDSDQDPRLSFGEGFGTFFAGAVLEFLGQPALYVDSHGAKQTGGFQLRLRLENAAPYLNGAAGASDEIAVACALYDLVDDADTADSSPGVDDDIFGAATQVDGKNRQHAWWEVFRGPLRRARGLTMNHAWDGWFRLHEADPAYAAMVSACDARDIRFWNDAFEPDNEPLLAQTLVATQAGTWSGERTLFYAPDGRHGPGTGDQDWYAVNLTAGQVVDVETRYPGGAWDARTQVDPCLTLFDPNGKRVAFDEDSGTGRNALVAELPVGISGTWHVRVLSRSRVARYGRYELRVHILSQP